LFGCVEQGAAQSAAAVGSGHLQVGQLCAAQRQLGGMLGVDEENPPGRLIARPGDEVGALAGQLLAHAK